MAYSAKAARAGSLARTIFIYIWPTDELVARSWQWPAFWHEAFEQAADRIGYAVAMCIAGGRPIGEGQAGLRLSVGCITFSTERRGASISIAVSDFTGPETPGPDAPGPDGGRQQPRSADGLVLGLRKTARNSHLVVFHGFGRFFPRRLCGRRYPRFALPMSDMMFRLAEIKGSGVGRAEPVRALSASALHTLPKLARLLDPSTHNVRTCTLRTWRGYAPPAGIPYLDGPPQVRKHPAISPPCSQLHLEQARSCSPIPETTIYSWLRGVHPDSRLEVRRFLLSHSGSQYLH